jgi:Putative DnaT-like ssDNA binding protein
MTLVVGTNSYINVVDADTYFEHAIHAASWVNAEVSVKESALVTATRTLDRQNWKGEKYQDAPTQVLDFPRSGLTDSEGNPVDETAVPQEILDATCELGLALIEDNDLQDNANTGSNIKKLKAGSAEIEYIRGTRGTRFPVIINELIGPWLSGTSSYSGPFIGGADNETSFSGPFNLTRGY